MVLVESSQELLHRSGAFGGQGILVRISCLNQTFVVWKFPVMRPDTRKYGPESNGDWVGGVARNSSHITV